MRESFFQGLYKIMKQDKRVILLISDTGAIVLDEIRANLKDRCINVGIAESNMVSLAAGLAMSGKIVYIYAIVPFVTMRCYEQIRVDVCCQNLPVKIIGIGAGLDYSTLGPTHHGHEDIGLMRMLPEMVILSPSDKTTANRFADISYRLRGPAYIRLERYGKTIHKNLQEKFNAGAKVIEKGRDICVIATGRMVLTALEVARLLKKKSLSATVIDLYRIKPLNEGLILRTMHDFDYVVAIEEHSVIGGIGSAISELLAQENKNCKFRHFGFPDKFCRKYGSRQYLHSLLNIDTKNIAKSILGWMGR